MPHEYSKMPHEYSKLPHEYSILPRKQSKLLLHNSAQILSYGCISLDAQSMQCQPDVSKMSQHKPHA